MIKGKTSTGFEYCIEDETLDNYELLEKFEELETNPGIGFVGLPKLLLGKGQTETLKEHVRSLEGKVSISGMMKEVMEILNSNSETKNS